MGTSHKILVKYKGDKGNNGDSVYQLEQVIIFNITSGETD